MTEEQVRKIAENFVAEKSLAKCTIVGMRKYNRSEIPDPTTVGDVWVVEFQFGDDEDVSASYMFVVVDDADGKPKLFESL